MRRLVCVLGAAALAACATVKPEHPVRVIGGFSPAPVGCQELGPVKLEAASSLDFNPVGSSSNDMLVVMTAAKGGDTLHMTSAFPAGGIAYRCNP